MKKIVSTFALALLVGGLTFAQDASVKVGAWGRGIFVPVATGGLNSEGDEASQTLLGVSWGGAPRVGITVAGNSEFVGFQADINTDNGGISAGDQQKIWVKPFPGLTLQLGQAYDDTLRGNSAFGSWDWIRLGPINGEDDIFKRVDTQKGFEVSYGVDAFYAFVSFNKLANAGAVDLSTVALKNLQLGAGYTIKDIGLIRVQMIGTAGIPEVPAVPAGPDTTFEDLDGDGVDDDFTPSAGSAAVPEVDAYNTIEAAFRLTAVQNLYLDVGLKYPTDADIAGYANKISLYGNYTVDAAKIHALVQYTSPNDDGEVAMGFGAGLDYGLGDGLGLGADVRYYSAKGAFGEALDPSDSLITVFAGLTKGFSNGLVGIGIQYATTGTINPDNGLSTGNLGILSVEGAPQFYLPVRLEYWF